MKLRETLHRYNSKSSDFRLRDEGSLEERNLTLERTFSFSTIRHPVAEISSCKEKGNFLIVYRLLPRHALPRNTLSLPLTDLSQTPDERQTRFLEKRSTHFPGKIYGPLGRGLIHNPRVVSNIITDSLNPLYLGNRSRYPDKTKSGSNGTVSSVPSSGF